MKRGRAVVLGVTAAACAVVAAAGWAVLGGLQLGRAGASAASVLVTVYDERGAVVTSEYGFFISPRRLVIHRHILRGAAKLDVQAADGRKFNITHMLAEDLNLDTILLATDVPVNVRRLPKPALETPRLDEKLTVSVLPLESERADAGGTGSSEVVVSDAPDDSWELQDFFFVDGDVPDAATGSPLTNAAGEIVGYGTFVIADGRPIRLIISTRVVESLMRRADHNRPRDFAQWMSANGKDVKLSNMGRLGRLASWAGREEDAAACYVEATKLEPGNAEMWTALSMAYTGLGRHAEAAAAAESALKADPEYRRGEARGNLAWSYEQLGRHDEAAAAYAEQIRRGEASAVTYDNLGLVYLKMGLNEEALASFREAVRLNGRSAEMRNNLAVALNRLGRRDEAVEQLKTAIENDTTSALAHQNLGDNYLGLGRYEDAIKECRKALALDPKRADSYVDIGAAYMSMGKNDEAVTELLKGISIKPDYPIAHRNLAFVYGQMGKFEEAIKEANEALRLDPKYVSAYNDLGYAYRELKRYDESVEALVKAIELDPKRSTPQECLGYTYVRMGKKDLAMRQYEILKELDPKEAPWLLKAIGKM
jgi:tetratricopeptide (TPR) repeat protein